MTTAKTDTYFAKLFKVTNDLSEYVNKNSKIETKNVLTAVHKKTLRLKKTFNGVSKEDKLNMIKETFSKYESKILKENDTDDGENLKWLEDADLTFKITPKHCIKVSVYYMIAKGIQETVSADLAGSPDSSYEGHDELNYADIIALQTFRILSAAVSNKEEKMRLLEIVGDLEDSLGIDSSKDSSMPPFMDGIKNMLGGLDINKTLGDMGIDLGENGGDIQTLVSSLTNPGEVDKDGVSSAEKVKNIIGKITKSNELGEGIGDAMKGLQDGNMDMAKLMSSMGGLLKNPELKGKLGQLVQATMGDDDPEKASRIVNNITEGNIDNVMGEFKGKDNSELLSKGLSGLMSVMAKTSNEPEMSRGEILKAIESSTADVSTEANENNLVVGSETLEVAVEEAESALDCDDDGICLIKTR